MKRFPFVIIVHFVLITASLYGSTYFFAARQWWSCVLLFLLAIFFFFNLYRIHTKVVRSIRTLFRSIHANDTLPSLDTDGNNSMTREIADELASILYRFQDRVVEGEAMRIYYEALLDQMDTAVLICNSRRRVIWSNQATHKWLGKKFVPPAEWFTSQGDEPRIVSLQREDRKIEAMLSFSLIRIRQGERYLFTLKDVHSLLERNEMEAWQKLIRVLTHEIMNSITPIASLSDTLCERAETEEPSPHNYDLMVQAMQTIRRRSEGLLKFIDNYRKLTRIPAPVYSDIALKGLAADLEKLYPDTAIHIRIEPENARLQADREQLEQVLINLIKNAFEACSEVEEPHIAVTFREDEQHAVSIDVSDNGKGILPDALERIFVPFFTTKEKGSGIGLSLCKQIMALHKGCIRVSSEPDKGTCFTLQFPAPQENRS